MIDFDKDERFELRSKAIKGTAYLIAGSKKATLDMINAVSVAIPAGPARVAAKAQMKKALVIPFEFSRDIFYVVKEHVADVTTVFAGYGRTDDEAENTRKALTYVATKMETNQMDTIRSAHVQELLDANSAVMAQTMGILAPIEGKTDEDLSGDSDE